MYSLSPLDNSFSLIIPAYNEEKRIGETIRELEANIPEIKEILVIFDGQDNTPEIARNSGQKVRVLEFKEKLGKGGAVMEGFRAASGETVCFTDADGSAPWYEVKRICSEVSLGHPAVIGSRWMRTSIVKKRGPMGRIVASRLFHYFVFTFLGITTKDTQCGLKAFTKETAIKLSERVKVRDWTFDVAVLLHLKKMGIVPLEVGIEWVHEDNSKLSVFKVIPLMLITVIGLRVRHSKKFPKNIQKEVEKMYDLIKVQ